MNRRPSSQLSDTVTSALDRLARGEWSDAAIGQLSGVDRASTVPLRDSWARLPVDTRRHVVRRMAELAESDLALDFNRVLQLALDDQDEDVRAFAVVGLWEDDSTAMLERLLTMLEREPEDSVREVVIEALGRFCYRAGLDELAGDAALRLRSALLEVVRSTESAGVRRRALESVSYFPDREVEESILDAYESGENAFRLSALTAMGRNLSDRWIDVIIDDLEDFDDDIRLEAARAAGEFEADRAVDGLIGLLSDADIEVQAAAINALGQIGGALAIEALREARLSSDPAVRQAASEALEQATQSDAPSFDLP